MKHQASNRGWTLNVFYLKDKPLDKDKFYSCAVKI